MVRILTFFALLLLQFTLNTTVENNKYSFTQKTSFAKFQKSQESSPFSVDLFQQVAEEEEDNDDDDSDSGFKCWVVTNHFPLSTPLFNYCSSVFSFQTLLPHTQERLYVLNNNFRI